MSDWMSGELDKVGAAEEMELASLRGDGSLRRAVTIWDVRLGDTIYVRAIHGRASAWFRGAAERHEGHIAAGGVEKDVQFQEESDPGLMDQIDAAYRTKYHRYAKNIVNTTLSQQARAATLRITPRP
ncbi:MAG TPA: DUF2255 family protein [Ktedonobacterales bacterium]